MAGWGLPERMRRSVTVPISMRMAAIPAIHGQRRADEFRVWEELTRGKLFRSAFIWVWHTCISASAMPVRKVSAPPRILKKTFTAESRTDIDVAG